jgi:hypothetical protein
MSLTWNAKDRTLGGHTHADLDDQGYVRLYSIEHCEHCGCECMAPNPIKCFTGPQILALAIGMVNRRAPASELYANEDGEAVCDKCY